MSHNLTAEQIVVAELTRRNALVGMPPPKFLNIFRGETHCSEEEIGAEVLRSIDRLGAPIDCVDCADGEEECICGAHRFATRAPPTTKRAPINVADWLERMSTSAIAQFPTVTTCQGPNAQEGLQIGDVMSVLPTSNAARVADIPGVLSDAARRMSASVQSPVSACGWAEPSPRYQGSNAVA